MSSGHATLLELSTVYSIVDLMDFHELIDIEIDMERSQQPTPPTMPRVPR